MSDRLYSLLLGLYPRAFRERHGEEMARLFRDRLRDEPAARVWIDVLLDAARSIPRQHLVPGPHPIYPPSFAPQMRAAHADLLPALVATAIVAGSMILVPGVAASGRHRDTVAWLLSHPASWLLAGLLLVVWFIMVRRALRASRALMTYRAEVGADSVTVAWPGAEPLSVARTEIVGVHVFEKIGMRIQTMDADRDLWVPVSAASYAHVKESLSHSVPVTVTPLVLGNPGFPLLALLYALVLFLPMTFAGFPAGVLLVRIPAALRNRDLPVYKKLLVVGPMIILVVRTIVLLVSWWR